MTNPLNYSLMYPEYGGLIVTGTIRCAKCDTSFKGQSGICPKCGYIKCYLNVYWRGKHYKFRKDANSNPFTYITASRELITISREIINKGKSFDPADWLASRIKERRFENQIENWIEQKREEVSNNDLAPKTFVGYQGYIRNYYLPFFEGKDVREIQFEDLENFKDSLKGKKQKSRKNILDGLKSFFKWLWQKGVVKQIPPFPRIEVHDSTERTAIEYQEQIEALERIPEKHRDIFEFGYESGLRPGELCVIRINDIDTDMRTARIQRTYSANKIRETTKGKHKDVIPLSDRAFEIAMQRVTALRSKNPVEINPFLFLNPNTNRNYKPEGLRRLWRKYSNIEATYYEAGRHTFCTQIVNSGANEFEAQKLMRHRDPRSTRAYFHERVNRLRDIVNRRGKIVPIQGETVKAKKGK